jgi:hypothetical protein
MELASEILDTAQVYLHDDGTLWPREELLGYLNNGYMRMLTETDAIRRLAAYDVPPRYRFAITYPWERQHADCDFYREWTLDCEVGTHYRVSYAWEGEHLVGATPRDSSNTVTQQWERIHGGVVEKSDRYVYPDDILSTYRIWFNGIRIHPTSIRELDDYTARWDKTTGRPFWYSPGLGRQREFEVWPGVVAYTQTAALQGQFGTIRSMSDSISAPTGALGTVRQIAGTVQFVCENFGGEDTGAPPFGIIRRWVGSEDSLLLDYSNHAPTLEEEDAPELLPTQFAKYLRFYVISRALAREGEGNNSKLADHYEQKWKMGVDLLHRIALLATSARTYQNLPQELRQLHPMRPRLPAEYPRIR